MTKLTKTHLTEATAFTPVRCVGRRDDVRQNFDAEIRLPCNISQEFLSAALIWAIENGVEFGLFQEADQIILAHFGGDETFLPSKWTDNRWHIGLEARDTFDPAD